MSIRLRLDLDSEIAQVIVQGLRQRPYCSSTGPSLGFSSIFDVAYYHYGLRINRVIKGYQKDILAGACIEGFPECRPRRVPSALKSRVLNTTQNLGVVFLPRDYNHLQVFTYYAVPCALRSPQFGVVRRPWTLPLINDADSGEN